MKNRKLKKVTPQLLVQMIDPAVVLDAIEDAATMLGATPFAVIISDPRSLQGCALIAAVCEPPAENEASVRERAMRIFSNVEGAQLAVERTGAMNVQFSCVPLDVLDWHLDHLGLSRVSADLEKVAGGEPPLVIFAVDEVAVASMQLRPVAVGEA